MDDKYNGCNIVESKVTENRSGKSRQSEPKSGGTFFFLRLVIAAAVIGFILVLHYFPSISGLSAVSEVLSDVFCYDVFGRSNFGVGSFFG